MPRPSSATATPTITRWSATSSTSGSTAAAPTSSRSKAATGPTSAGPPTSISKARTSIAAGSSRRCSKAAARAGARRYDAVLTHGFTMDAKGMKMSKSLGNTVNPLDLMKRLWRRHPAAVGAVGRLHRGPPDRQGDPRRGRRPVSQAPQHLPLSARRARRVQRGGAARRRRAISRARALHAPPDRRARREAPQRGR